MPQTRTPADILRRLAESDGDVVAAPPAGAGAGHWVGAPSALRTDGAWWLAHRVRMPSAPDGGSAIVISRSRDGVAFEEVARLDAAGLEAAELDRPALVRLPWGGWRLYVSCADAGTGRWRVDVVDAPTAAGLAHGIRNGVLVGDEEEGWKDPVVWAEGERWWMWATRHPLGENGSVLMSSQLAESSDGLTWGWTVRSLRPSAGTWDQAGMRVTAVHGECVFYDGRSGTDLAWEERTGLACGDPLWGVQGPAGRPGHSLRFLSLVEGPEGLRAYWEAGRVDGPHDLRTALVG